MTLNIFKAYCLFFWSRYRTCNAIYIAAVLLTTGMPYLIFLGLIHKILTILIPAYAIFFTLFVFSFGDSNTRISGESNFPSHFFSLPVNTSTLIVYPVILGSCLMIINCLLVDRLWLKPWGINIDYWWAVFLAISLLAWYQVIIWKQYRLAWSAIVLACLLITALVSISFYIYYIDDKLFMIVPFLSLQLGMAFYLAVRSVSKARKGFILEPWKWTRGFSFSLARINRTHNSPFQAQCYLENRLHGRLLPAMIVFLGIVYLAESLCFLFSYEDPKRISTLAITAVCSLSMCFCFCYVISANWFTFYSADWYIYNKTQSTPEDTVMPNFISTLPITNQDIIKAKFIAFSKNAAACFLLFIGLIFVIFGVYLVVSYPGIAWPPCFARIGQAKVITALIVIPVLGIVITILNSLASMWISLLKKTFFIMWIPVILLFVAKEIWVDTSWLELLLTYYPWPIGIVCTLKLISICSFLPWLTKNNYYRINTLLKSVVAWIFFMGLCFAFVIWISPVKLSYALIWGCLVCITPILGLLGTPVALKYSRTQ